jgi:MFS family permease
MRRLLLLVCGLVWVDTMLYAALTPLLPHFAHTLHLSKGFAGLLVGAYAAGALVGGLPGGAAAVRLGARRAVLVGLALMGLSSLGFAFASGYWALFGARFLQGAGSAFTWAGAFAWLLAAVPRARRGEVIGTALGAAVFGALLGPVVGTLAALVGRDVVFTALAGLAIVFALTVVAWRWKSLIALGALLVVHSATTLAPLHLAAAGWGAAAIGAV